MTLWSSRDSQSGFPAASSVEGRAAAGEVGGLSVAPVFSSCLPSYNFVTIYFPLLNPVLLEIPRVVSIAYTRCLLYAVLLYTLSLSRICTDDSLSRVTHSLTGDHNPYSKTHALPTTPCPLLPDCLYSKSSSLPFTVSLIPVSQADVHSIPLPVGSCCLTSIFTFPL